MANLNNWGDLKALILQIKTKQRNQKIISQGKEFALDQILGFLPGASNAKTLFDFINAARNKNDTKKTNTWLDNLDMDDEMLKIIDDAIENGFMEFITKVIESKPDNQPLPDDFSMDDEMMEYLKSEYRNRTVVGYQESKSYKGKNKMNIKTIIREEIMEALKGGNNLREFDINSGIKQRVGVLVKKLSDLTQKNRHLDAVIALNDFLLQDAKNTNSLYFKAASPRKSELESSKRMLDQIKSKMKSGNAGSDAVMLNKRMIDTRQQLMDIAIKIYGKDFGREINTGF